MFRRLGFYPTETSEHSCEYVPWYLHHDSEIERLRLPIGEYLDIVAANEANYERTRSALAAGEPLPVEAIWRLCDDMVLANADRLQPGLRAVLAS